MYDYHPMFVLKNNIYKCYIENKNKTHADTHKTEIYTPSFWK